MRPMKHAIGWLLVGIALAGCRKSDPPPTTVPEVDNTPLPSSAQASPNAGSGGVQIGPGFVGGATPVTGNESLQGGGSGVGQVMKERARGIGNAPSSLDQMGGD